jgi:hypothetical protein
VSRRGPRRIPRPTGGHTTVGVHVWADTAQALAAFAADRGLYLSGAAHILLRQALGLPPIPNDNEN